MENIYSKSDLYQSMNNADTHQYRFYNIPHIVFIVLIMYPMNITSSGVHHIVIPQKWKEVKTQPYGIRIHVTLE